VASLGGVDVNLETIQKLWWRLGLLNAAWCAAFWLVSQGVGASVPLLGSINPQAGPPIFGPLVALPLLMICIWLGRRHVANSQLKGWHRLPQPPELNLNGDSGLKVRIACCSIVLLFPLLACVHFLHYLLRGQVYAFPSRKLLGPVYSTFAFSLRDDYRFYDAGITFFPVIQPALYVTAFAGAVWMLCSLLWKAKPVKSKQR
jgi:hypothetical protein